MTRLQKAAEFRKVAAAESLRSLLNLDTIWDIIQSKLDLNTVLTILDVILPAEFDALIQALRNLFVKAKQTNASRSQVEGMLEKILRGPASFGAGPGENAARMECVPDCDGDCEVVHEYLFADLPEEEKAA